MKINSRDHFNMRVFSEIQQSVSELVQLEDNLLQRKYLQIIQKMGDKIISTIKAGNKLLIAGNGGSASQAEHFTSELVNKYVLTRKGLPAVALTTDSSIITSVSNDYGYEEVFSRQIQSLGKKDDLFLAISTSGNSANIIQGLKSARAKGLVTLALLGRNGGKAKKLCDLSLIVPAYNTPRIQECHLLVIHIFCGMIDRYFKS